ncbi:MAG: TonB-dependent receptor [Bacteroidales bacterium]|jgi:iron complex outermembrane receptor protein|nr:TonB-dependent receptor [Bacteroidales bacterium]
MKRIGVIFLFVLFIFPVYAQQTISGVVKNQQGEPLVGANVSIKETYRGTATNMNGEFKLSKLKPDSYTIMISYIGYKTLEDTINSKQADHLEFILEPSNILSDDVIIKATRAKIDDPVSFTNISRQKIKENNFTQDIPYLLSQTPSIISTSDAGTGVGYTYFRVRGTDLNRINITLNGIPVNDAESHGVWFVNMPDLLSSVNNIQIQRGVGTSTHGAASFGGTLNLQTKTYHKDAYAEINSYAGSFNTFRNSVSFGTGLINNRFTFDGRLSKVTSDGFIDRAWSDLKSFYLSGGYHTNKSILKVNIISGKEITYQAWNGVPKVRLEDDAEGMQRYLDHWLIDEEEYNHMINSDSRTYNLYTYENEVDNYQQDHYQLFYSYEINPDFHLSTALHYTRGRGYYEQYKKDKDFEDYLLDQVIIGGDTISSTDLIQQKWLDNHFYGAIFSVDYKQDIFEIAWGGGWNRYIGDHFGEVIWAQYFSNGEMNHRWYEGDGDKRDFNLYTKFKYHFSSQFSTFIDLQYRKINYDIQGIDDDLRDITQSHNFNFFNPKFGIFYEINDLHSSFFTFAVANREPNRSNYTDADPSRPAPTHETLYDLELGYNYYSTNNYLKANLYYMYYKDQLVLTGKINDVGSAIMTNVDKSYRLGLELSGGLKVFNQLQVDGNVTLSQNKIKNFTEYVDNWDTGEQEETNLGQTDLSFSPEVIANTTVSYEITSQLKTELISKYVGKQYIDNTSNDERSIDPYFVNDFKVSYSIPTDKIKEISVNIMVNNIFNHEYESNAWVYRYIIGGEEFVMDGYFPQAGINIMGGLTLKF